MMRFWIAVACLAFAGCAPLRLATDVFRADPEVAAAVEESGKILDALGVYIADPISQFEGEQILAVERDALAVQTDRDPVQVVEDVEALKFDWEILVAYDKTLQKEKVI